MDRQQWSSAQQPPSEASGRMADRLDRLSTPLAENVIRRAIELHHEDQFGGGAIDLDLVEQIGTDLGIPPELIRRALLEELQTDRHHADGWLEHLLGPDRVTGGIVARGQAEGIDRQVEEWMRRHEGMRPRAQRGRTIRWEKDPGLATALRRGLKRAQGTGALRTSPRVVTRQTEVGPGEQLVEIEADTSKVKAEAAGVGAAGVLGALAVGAGVAAAGGFAPDVVEFLAGFLPGLVAATAGVAAYAHLRISRTKDGINRALDGILNPPKRRHDDDRRPERRRKKSWIDIVEDAIDGIFD